MNTEEVKSGMRVRLRYGMAIGPPVGAVGTVLGRPSSDAGSCVAVSWDGWHDGWEQQPGSGEYCCWVVHVGNLERLEESP